MGIIKNIKKAIKDRLAEERELRKIERIALHTEMKIQARKRGEKRAREKYFPKKKKKPFFDLKLKPTGSISGMLSPPKDISLIKPNPHFLKK